MSESSNIVKPVRRRRKVDPDVVAPSADVAVPAVVEPEQPPVLMLTRDELHKLSMLELQVRHARAEAETCRIRKKWMLALLDPKGTVEAEEKRMEKWQKAMRSDSQQYETLKARISMRLNVDISKCGFDPETGVVVSPDSSA